MKDVWDFLLDNKSVIALKKCTEYAEVPIVRINIWYFHASKEVDYDLWNIDDIFLCGTKSRYNFFKL